MKVVIFVVLAIIYMMIGAFVAGVIDIDICGEDALFVLIWPLVIVLTLIAVVAIIPHRIGKKYTKQFDEWTNKHNL